MFGLNDFSIDFLTGTPLIIWLVTVLLLLLALHLYRRTNPPLPLYLRIVLTGLRVIAVLALMLALAEPVISFSRKYERPRQVTVLVDASASMERVERGKSRRERIDSLLSSDDFERLKDKTEVTTYYFGGNLSADRVGVEREKTSLGEVLEQLQIREMSQPADYWFILSDGNSNSGQEPRRAAARINHPLTTIDMSSDTGAFDIRISDIEYNPVLFVGQPTEFKVKLAWQNVAERNQPVRLLDSLRTVSQQMLPIGITEGLGEVSISWVPDEPGQKILRVDVPADRGEENTGNNQRSFSVKVLKSRLTVLIVTETPDYEVGFLKRLLEASDKYDVELLVTGSKSGNLSARFPSRQTELNRYDLIVLYDPDPVRLEPRRELLSSYLSERGGAVWVLLGENFSRRGPVSWFDELLPFYPSRERSIQYLGFRGEPSESHLFHPAVRLGDSPTAIREAWASLPPFQGLVRCDRIHPEATVLVTTALSQLNRDKFPLLGFRRFGAGKLMASAAKPFWTWGFVNLGFGEDPVNYENFVEGTISWLTVSDDLDPIRINPEKDVYHRGETIRFNGFAFDLGFRPIPGVTGTVGLNGADNKLAYETDLIERDEGAFRAELFNVAPGNYRYRAAFEKDGRLLKEKEGSIRVESFSIEEIDQSGDPATLTAISQLSGGGYFRFDRFDQAVTNLDLSKLAIEQQREITLLNRLWLLMIFVAAVCAEWLIRKVNQLL